MKYGRPSGWMPETMTREQNRRWVKGYLMQHQVPPAKVDFIIGILTNDAIQESKFLQYDRLFADIALVCKRVFNFGPKRTLRFMHAFDDLLMEAKDGKSWDVIAQECRDETGFVISTDAENRVVCEYMQPDILTARDVTEDE